MQPHKAAGRQRRGTAIAMPPAEVDRFLQAQPICRVATVGARGTPHISALWFVWDGTAVWFNSLVRSQRWTDLTGNPQLSALIDDGDTDFGRLRGVQLTGRVEIIGEVPRTGRPVPELTGPERLYAAKYAGGAALRHDHRHGWLRLTPRKIVSWDFARLPVRS